MRGLAYHGLGDIFPDEGTESGDAAKKPSIGRDVIVAVISGVLIAVVTAALVKGDR